MEIDKVAAISYRPLMCSDDGRALSGDWTLDLNDYGGAGFWHGGTSWPTEEAAMAEAERLGYTVTRVRWA